MYIDKYGNEWSSEENYEKIGFLMGHNLNYELALENYADCTGDESIFKSTAFEKYANYLDRDSSTDEAELLNLLLEINKLFKALVKEVGYEKFTFYDDDTVCFNWSIKG